MARQNYFAKLRFPFDHRHHQTVTLQVRLPQSLHPSSCLHCFPISTHHLIRPFSGFISKSTPFNLNREKSTSAIFLIALLENLTKLFRIF
ncbi:hypothetical protein L2E82_01322 [Cichorium intybus]|uniref:Uncharacterized protein n=1 Tax=Cichorium intybus TaxID=13427 RepID=A0ACB9GZ00_CICIN|nr:hypothetical protein L2E82_01322 [Cichorium intybus]